MGVGSRWGRGALVVAAAVPGAVAAGCMSAGRSGRAVALALPRAGDGRDGALAGRAAPRVAAVVAIHEAVAWD